MARLRAALLLALALPSAALALAPLPPECPDGLPDHLDGGMVGMIRTAPVAPGGPEVGHILLTHCASGRSLVVQPPPSDPSASLYDLQDAAYWVVRRAVASPDRITLDDLRARLDARVGPTAFDAMSSPSQETCGCHLLQPDLRGDKTPWTK